MKRPHNRPITTGDRSAAGDDPWLDKEIEAIRQARQAQRKQQASKGRKLKQDR
jgi:hypothetical protein